MGIWIETHNFTTGPLGFAFVMEAPITLPVGVPTIVQASLEGSLTDGTGDGVTFAPLLNSTILQNSVLPLGFAWGTGPKADDGPGGYGSFVFGPAVGPLGPGAPFLTESISFTLSGDNDGATLFGWCAIDPVPVPPTLVLMGSGLLGLVG